MTTHIPASHEPATRYLLVTLTEETGESSDLIAGDIEDYLRDHVGVHDGTTVQHLTPETLPDRYEESKPIIRAAALAYLHGDDMQGWNGEQWADWQNFLSRLAEALDVRDEDVEALDE